MTQTFDSTSKPFRSSLAIRMLIGGAIGFAIIALFVFGVNDPDPAWGKYWRIRPLIITPLAGAMGGLCNYFLTKYYFLAGMNKTVATIISAVVFIVGLWLGIVLGLDGTLWD